MYLVYYAFPIVITQGQAPSISCIHIYLTMIGTSQHSWKITYVLFKMQTFNKKGGGSEG